MRSPADLSDPGIELGSPALQADSLPAELSGKPKLKQWKSWKLPSRKSFGAERGRQGAGEAKPAQLVPSLCPKSVTQGQRHLREGNPWNNRRTNLQSQITPLSKLKGNTDSPVQGMKIKSKQNMMPGHFRAEGSWTPEIEHEDQHSHAARRSGAASFLWTLCTKSSQTINQNLR